MQQLRHEFALALGSARALLGERDDQHGQSAVSCVVKALVEATPISGPARVNSTRSDSRTIELSATLQIESVER